MLVLASASDQRDAINHEGMMDSCFSLSYIELVTLMYMKSITVARSIRSPWTTGTLPFTEYPQGWVVSQTTISISVACNWSALERIWTLSQRILECFS